MNGPTTVAIVAGIAVTSIGFVCSGQVTFDEPVDYPTDCLALRRLVLADLNGDGHLDVAVACQIKAAVVVLLNNGDGSFGRATDHPVAALEPLSVAAGDWDGDGDIDLATANSGSNADIGGVSILLNDGAGNFEVGEVHLAGERPQFILACNLNGDPYPDLAVTNGNSNDVTILLNDANGKGTFTPSAENYPVAVRPRGIAAGRLNNDNAIDLVIGNEANLGGDSEVSVLFNSGDGTFGTAVNVTVADFNEFYGSGPGSVALADLNNDDNLDLIAVIFEGGSELVRVLLGDGKGGFGDPQGYSPGGLIPTGVVVSDLDGDGELDIVVVLNHAISYLPGNGDGMLR